MRSIKRLALATTALCIAFLPASAQQPPKAPVLRVNPSSTGTAAPIEMQNGSGGWTAIGTLNPSDGVFQGANSVPAAFTASALGAMRTTSYAQVLRLAFGTAGDGPAIIYRASATACSLNGGAGDGGAQIRSADGKCWLAVFGPDGADVRIWGADALGRTDSTAAIQAALNSGASLSVVVPAGTFKACGLVIPPTFGLVIRGAGTPSKLVQGSCGAPLFGWSRASIAYPEQTIRDISFDGAMGLADTIDTRGVGGLTLMHLYFGDLPVGYSGILVDGVGVTTHDDRITDVRAYPTTAAKAVIHFGPLASDVSLDGLIAHGHNTTQDIVLIDAGANNIAMSNSHPYNAARHILHAEGCDNCQFTNVTFDAGQAGDVYLSNAHNAAFNGDYFESIQPGQSGMTLNNSTAVNISASIFQAQYGAAAAVTETGNSDYNVVLGGDIGTLAYYTNPQVFAWNGAHSYSRSVPGVSALGLSYSFSGVTTAPLTSGSVSYLGVNGAQASPSGTNYVVAQNGTIQSASILTDYTPAAGQNFSFTVYDGNTAIGTGTISSGSYITTINLNRYVAQYDTIYIKATFSASSGSANVRYAVNFAG